MGLRQSTFLNLLSALFLGSSLSLIVTKLLITGLGLNFLSSDIPGVTAELAYDKTFDLADFVIAGILSLIIFLVNQYGASLASRFFKRADFKFGSILLFIFAAASFIQTHFLVFSTSQVLIMVTLFEAAYFGIGVLGYKFSLERLKSIDALKLQNGIFLGFLLMLITNNLTTIPALSLSFLVLVPLVFLCTTILERVHKRMPGALVLLAILFPTNLIYLVLLLVSILGLGFLFSKFKDGLPGVSLISRFVNPAALVFIAAFNPLFFIGNFDSVEEGFWLAWVQRLSEGQILYRDVFVYHSPLIPWGMYLFSLISGFSIYSERLYLHLLQVLGLIIFFFFSRMVLKSNIFAILSTFTFMAVTSTLVRNNIEIRVGFGLAALILLFTFFRDRKWWRLLGAGLISGACLFLSLEAGIAVVFASIFAIFINSEKKISLGILRDAGNYCGGVLISSSLILGYMLLTGSLSGFLEQNLFYAKAFSQGYFNSAMERSVTHAYFHFDVFDEYLDSVTIFWEAAKLTFIGFLIYFFYKLTGRKSFSGEEVQVFTTAFFGLILTRAALGRSDWYHLLFVLGIALLLIFYTLAKLFSFNKLLSLGLILFLMLVMTRVHINNSFLEKTIFRYQTYGKLTTEHKEYSFERGRGALLGLETDADSVSNVVKYIQDNTNESDKIFVYPWNPEIYFYADRTGSSKIDTPYAFFSEAYQNLMVEDLKNNPPELLIYNDSMNFGGFSADTLPLVNKFIQDNYEKSEGFGNFDVLIEAEGN